MADLLKKIQSTADVGRFAALAARYCENKHGGLEGNEIIFAALVNAMAIRASCFDIVEAIERIEGSVDAVANAVDSMSTSGVEAAVEELIKAVDGAADRI